jgi:hypothetical protein
LAKAYTDIVVAHPFICLLILLLVVTGIKHGGEWLRRLFEGF